MRYQAAIDHCIQHRAEEAEAAFRELLSTCCGALNLAVGILAVRLMATRSTMQSENAYELLVQGVMDYAIYMLDPEGRVVSWNPGAERIKGYTTDEIVGGHFSQFYTAEDRAAGVPKRALHIAAESGRFTTEAWRVRKDGTRF